MHEWVHVIRLVLGKDIHGYADTVGDTLVVQHFPGRVVVSGDCGIQAVQASGCYEDGAIAHGLCRCVPTGT